MTTYQRQHYLVIRPISEDPAMVEPYLDPLSDTTGLDQITLRQRLIGTALRVLKVHHDRDALERMSGEFKKKGLASAVISKDELMRLKKPLRSSSLEIGQKTITFLSPNSDLSPLSHNSDLSQNSEGILSIDGSQNCLMVLATMEFKKLQGKRLARLTMNAGNPLPLSEMLACTFRSHPVLDLYLTGSDIPIRIDSTKFNYNCLGEANKQSAALNLPAIMGKISRFCSSVILDTGFGENELPFLNCSENPTREGLIREFTIYSAAVFLAWQRGLFNAPGAEEAPNAEESPIRPDVPALSDITGIVGITGITGINGINGIKAMNGIIWGGPVLSSTKSPARQDSTTGSENHLQTPLSPAPQRAAVYRSNPVFGPLFTLVPSLKNVFKGDLKWIKTMGPPIFLYPLTALVLISFGLSYAIRNPAPLSLGVICLGLILFIHAFVLLQRKKTIENCPTSKIRSMSMGQVEIKGQARQKYYLKSPHTLTDCVYYSYKVYETVWDRDGQRQELKEWGNSGPVPFYLEDETGRTLVLPGEAVVHAGSTQTMLGDPLTKIFGGSSSSSSRDRKIVETVIPVGQLLYVIGFARRLKVSAEEKKKKFIEKLRDLKTDPARLRQYDLNQDGKISQEEWELARKDAEEEALLEELSSDPETVAEAAKDRVAIGEHPSGGLFYISDKREERILRSMSWGIPVSLALGVGGITGGLFYLLKFVQNRAILLALKGLLWP